MGENEVPGARSVAGRVFAVLDAFDGVEGALRLTVIAERAGLPLPTALRMVRDLVAWGGLERQRDGSYRVGRRLWTLGSASPCVRRVREVAAPHLQDLHATTGQNVLIAIRDETSALLLDRVNGSSSLAIRARVGDRLPLHATGVGRILLAFAPAAVADDVLRPQLRRFTPYTVTTPGRLLGDLQRIRETRIAFVHHELQIGAISVAAPVAGSDGTTLAAVGVVAPSHVQIARFTTALRRAAAGISRELATDLACPTLSRPHGGDVVV